MPTPPPFEFSRIMQLSNFLPLPRWKIKYVKTFQGPGPQKFEPCTDRLFMLMQSLRKEPKFR